MNTQKEPKPQVGRATYISGEVEEFTDADAYIQRIKEELPYHATTGFRYEVLTRDPTIRKAADDALFDLYGMENPSQLKDYEPQDESSITMGGMCP